MWSTEGGLFILGLFWSESDTVFPSLSWYSFFLCLFGWVFGCLSRRDREMGGRGECEPKTVRHWLRMCNLCPLWLNCVVSIVGSGLGLFLWMCHQNAGLDKLAVMNHDETQRMNTSYNMAVFLFLVPPSLHPHLTLFLCFYFWFFC